MCESVKVARMASERIKEECRIQSGGKKQSQKTAFNAGDRHTKKASTEALAFSGLKSVAPNEDQSFRHVVSVAFSMRLLARQRLMTMLIAEDLTD